MAVEVREIPGVAGTVGFLEEPDNITEFFVAFPNIISDFKPEPLILRSVHDGEIIEVEGWVVGRHFDGLEAGSQGEAAARVTEYFETTGKLDDPIFHFGVEHFNGRSEHAEMVRSRPVPLAQARKMFFSSMTAEPAVIENGGSGNQPTPQPPIPMWRQLGIIPPNFR